MRDCWLLAVHGACWTQVCAVFSVTPVQTGRALPDPPPASSRATSSTCFSLVQQSQYTGWAEGLVQVILTLFGFLRKWSRWKNNYTSRSKHARRSENFQIAILGLKTLSLSHTNHAMCKASPLFPRQWAFRDDCTINKIKSQPPFQGENKVVIAAKFHLRI